MPRSQPEPWLRGTPQDDRPEIAQVLYTFTQATEDLSFFTQGFAPKHMWMRPFDLGSIGFHIQHLAGSIDRLLTYAEGKQLSEEQLAHLRSEHEGSLSRDECLGILQSSLKAAEARVRSIKEEQFGEERFVGRQRLPTTVIGLLIHVAEHAQRHVGQAVVVARVIRAMEGLGPAS